MPLKNFLQEAMTFEVQVYRKPTDFKALRKTHVPFTGSPQRHPQDKNKLILVTDPCSTSTFYYEFDIGDVSYVEELANLVDLNGNTVPLARVWIKKMSIGLRCLPFIVDDIRFG
jgi:hypothetical protein